MERLARAGVEAVAHELAVAAREVAADDLVAAVADVVEEGVPDVFHVCPDLVRAAGFEHAFDEGGEAEPLDGAPMGDGGFADA